MVTRIVPRVQPHWRLADVRSFAAGLVWSLLLASLVVAADRQRPLRRARPPVWEKFPTDIFFEDAFAEGLRGERPARHSKSTVETPPSKIAESTTNDESTRVASGAWSQVISGTVLENELKAIEGRAAGALKNEGVFRGQGNLIIQQDYAVAAMVFGIIHEYDGEVRWKRDAAAARDLFARAANNARAPAPQVFRESQQRLLDLQELIRGSALNSARSESLDGWPAFAPRRPLMQRLDRALEQELTPAVANEKTFRSKQTELQHQAELTAALARILKQPGMEEATDEEYVAWCNQLESAAVDLATAAHEGRFTAASPAQAAIRKACTDCHEVYRSQ